MAEETGTEAVEIDVMASQGIEDISDADLRGEEVSEDKTDEVAKDEETTEVKEEETNEETEVTEEVSANSEPETKETPKGYVPLEAVHQARGEIKYLKEQLHAVQNQVQSLQSKPTEKEAEVPDTFEVLTDDEFEFLAEDDPTQAAIYLRNLNVHESLQRDAEQSERQREEFNRDYEAIIGTSVEAIEKVVPGIYDEGSEAGQELMDYGESIGFTDEMYYLTDPTTKIILAGESEPLLLGEQAAEILGMLVTAKSKSVPQDSTELEAKLRTEITAELMQKFKTPDSEEFRGLNQVPKSDSETPEPSSYTGKVLTTDQLLMLTDKELDAYLAGD